MESQYTIGTKVFTRESSGIYFPEGTPEPVRRELSRLRGKDIQVRIFCGDIATGKTWSEEWDSVGYISASMGPCRVPLLIHNARSMGGGSIMSDCVLAIKSRTTWLYRAPNFDNGNWTAAPINETRNGKKYRGAVYRDGELYGRCTSLEKAERLRAFMAGERMSK